MGWQEDFLTNVDISHITNLQSVGAERLGIEEGT